MVTGETEVKREVKDLGDRQQSGHRVEISKQPKVHVMRHLVGADVSNRQDGKNT
jgi:hypothetical protein